MSYSQSYYSQSFVPSEEQKDYEDEVEDEWNEEVNSQTSERVDEDQLIRKLEGVHFFSQHDEELDRVECKEMVKKFTVILEKSLDESKLTIEQIKGIGQNLLKKFKCLSKTQFIWSINRNINRHEILHLVAKATENILTE